MSFQSSALIATWAALLLLALVVSGLVRQVHALSAAVARPGARLGPRTGTPAPGIERLGLRPPAVLLFVSDDCRTCASVLAAAEATGQGIAVHALYAGPLPPATPATPVGADGPSAPTDGADGPSARADGADGPLARADGADGPLARADGADGPSARADGADGPLARADGAGRDGQDGRVVRHGGQAELFERYDAIATPFAVVIDRAGRVARSGPVGSPAALHAVLGGEP